jgi:hypothetical protein
MNNGTNSRNQEIANHCEKNEATTPHTLRPNPKKKKKRLP